VSPLFLKENTMPLTNFGAILGFAEELENQDNAFYQTLIENSACAQHKNLFEQFVKDGTKNIKTIQRTRRENVTEMILEAINDFTRQPYCEKCSDGHTLNIEEALNACNMLSERAERFYLEAADKLKALSEVARTMKQIAKKRKAHLKKLADLSS
jgi:rubrerythrin